jgi:hypothetical protein
VIAAGTIVRANYLPFARVLANSLRRHHPELPLTVLLIDEPPDDPGDLDVLRLEDLAIEDLRGWRFAYDAQELTVAAKPHLLAHLLERNEAAVFLDADVEVLGSLDALLSDVREHAIVLVPHLLAALETGDAAERERMLLLAGAFNGGVLGVSRREEGRRFLAWWADRMRAHCRHDVPAGMHYDQRWLDLVPSFFADVRCTAIRGSTSPTGTCPSACPACCPAAMCACCTTAATGPARPAC